MDHLFDTITANMHPRRARVAADHRISVSGAVHHSAHRTELVLLHQPITSLGQREVGSPPTLSARPCHSKQTAQCPIARNQGLG